MAQTTLKEIWDNYSFYVRDNRTGEEGWVSIQEFFAAFGLAVIESSKHAKKEVDKMS